MKKNLKWKHRKQNLFLRIGTQINQLFQKRKYTVVVEQKPNWILNTISDRISKASGKENHFLEFKGFVDHIWEKPYRDSRGAIFLHFLMFREFIRIYKPRKDAVFFTHYYQGVNPDGIEESELISVLKKANLIWAMCSYWKNWLIERGIDENKVIVRILGVDFDEYPLRKLEQYKEKITIGLVSKYHYRKNEEFILKIIKKYPQYNWILMGRHWQNTPFNLIEELKDSKHFGYIETSLDKWSDIYCGFDILVSPSFCEGGPQPLLEAMASGVWPISSKTGFGPDLIQHGKNGHVYDIDNEEQFDICLNEAVQNARKNPQTIRDSISQYTWDFFHKNIKNDFDTKL